MEITAPIIVVGLPRSGTTHLVNLIAADTRLRSLPAVGELRAGPRPRRGSGPASEPGADPRYRRAQDQWQGMEAMLPHMAAMHPMRPDHVHEELELQLPDFSSYQLEWVARVPRWRDYYLAHDQTPHYRLPEDRPPDPPVAPARGSAGCSSPPSTSSSWGRC